MCETTAREVTTAGIDAVMKEKLRTLTANELFETALKLSLENRELHARCEAQEAEIRWSRANDDRAYLRGRIEGLEFAARCNGVGGGEVQ